MCCSELQRVAACCSVLKRVAARCSMLQRVAACKHYLRASHTRCNTLQHAATHHKDICDTLQHIATHCNTLQHTATHCNTLQHTTTASVTHTRNRAAAHQRCLRTLSSLSLANILRNKKISSVTFCMSMLFRENLSKGSSVVMLYGQCSSKRTFVNFLPVLHPLHLLFYIRCLFLCPLHYPLNYCYLCLNVRVYV